MLKIIISFIAAVAIGIVVIVGITASKNDIKTSQFIKTTIIDEDITLNSGLIVPAKERIIVKDGATITIDGDVSVNGTIECENGPLTLVVNGTFSVDGELACFRDENAKEDDVGNALLLVLKDEVLFGKDATISSNGHIQVVDEIEKIAKTENEIEKLYDDAADDSGEGFRMGPFIDIPLAEGQPDELSILDNSNNKVSFVGALKNLIIHTAKAQAGAPAVDNSGDPVANTVKIGGRWVVGKPTQTPPKNIRIQTPPKNIKKIILAFNFGKGKNMNLANFTLYGPDGREGTEDTGSCSVKGGTGSNAMRMNVIAPNITINNFTLFLGYGGKGGFAETSNDCKHGKATGGKGGEPGNFKMIASNKFDIAGSFTIHPGQGGTGGQAVAHGKKGVNGCAGEKGGDATATGGKGGDNKKGLKVVGTVTGIGNVELKKIVAGDGGDGDADGGDGGDGDACGCDGGLGGTATATGGKGGTATSRNVESIGGDGGAVSSKGGTGGDGGTCDSTGPGGDGANGGDANVNKGKPGTGLTKNGSEGTVFGEDGGDGGDGGDGCNEGVHGNGGKGDPKGEDGKDGKNLCILPEKTGTSVQEDANKVSTGSQDEIDQESTDEEETIETEIISLDLISLDLVSIEPIKVNFTYDHSNPQCPLAIPSVFVDGPPDMNWQVVNDPPIWLEFPNSPQGNGPGQLQMEFPCLLDSYKNQDSFFDVFIEIEINGEQTQRSVRVNGEFTNF